MRCQVPGPTGVLTDVHIAYLVITLMAATTIGYAALLNFTGAESVKGVADRLQISQRWMVPFGTLLAAGAAGLVTGFAVPAVGAAAATGLTLYFVCAIGAHLRARDTGFGAAAFFLVLAVSALITNLAYQASVAT